MPILTQKHRKLLAGAEISNDGLGIDRNFEQVEELGGTALGLRIVDQAHAVAALARQEHVLGH
jgi:hypothetical protein